MGLDHLHLHQHHQAADGLTNLFTKANHDLSVIQYRLEKEFQQIYPDSVRATRSSSSSSSSSFSSRLLNRGNNLYMEEVLGLEMDVELFKSLFAIGI